MTRVYLVRHATHPLVGKVLAGRMPGVALSKDGESQARRLGAFFAATEVATLLSSPLERCRQTAASIADTTALPVMVDPGLDELDCGEWTGRPFSELDQDPRWRSWNSERSRARMPGGETIAAVQARAMPVIEQLGSADQGSAVVVTHSDVVKVVILSLLRAPLDLHDRLEIDPASVTTLDLWPGGGKIVRSNEAVA